MKNITVTMPEELARATRRMAAAEDTSMSRFLCRLVEEKVNHESEYQAAMNRFLSRKRGGIRSEGGPLPTRESLYDRHALR